MNFKALQELNTVNPRGATLLCSPKNYINSENMKPNHLKSVLFENKILNGEGPK